MIIEGRVGEIRIEEGEYFDTDRIAKAITVEKGQILNYTRLQKDITRINQRPDRKYKAVLKSGEEKGTSDIIVTMNARSLLNFFELRCCLHAQWEIRILANKMLQLVKNESPTIFSKAGPSCKTKGFCPENNPSCQWYPK